MTIALFASPACGGASTPHASSPARSVENSATLRFVVLGDNRPSGLADAGDRVKFVVTHRPVLPPTNSESRPYEERGFADKEMARKLAHDLETARTDIAFGGHEHLFDHQKQGPTNYITTGGAGAPLYAAGDQGGFFHYIVVDVEGRRVKTELVKLSGERKTLPL